MARIVLADDGVVFDGKSLDGKAAGGGETAFVRLAEAFAAQGHDVTATARGAGSRRHRGVDWVPLGTKLPGKADLFVANRSPHLLALGADARRRFFWLHNDARYLAKPRYVLRMLRHRSELVFVSNAHLRSAPWWLPARARHVIPLGLDASFRQETERAPPPPLALYAAHPLRGLSMLAPLWQSEIAPQVTAARLQVHTGLGLYGTPPKPRTAAAMQEAIDAARAAAGEQLTLGDLIDHAQLVATLRRARVYLYPGDPTETFCLSVAEAQAMGVPCVVLRNGALPERVVDGVTGFVVDGPASFADAARRLLIDDALWTAQHRACLASQGKRSWGDMAQDFARKAGL